MQSAGVLEPVDGEFGSARSQMGLEGGCRQLESGVLLKQLSKSTRDRLTYVSTGINELEGVAQPQLKTTPASFLGN